jgi:hypothetical protein
MERNTRLYPIEEELFNRLVLPIIEGNYIGKAVRRRCRTTKPSVEYYTYCEPASLGGTYLLSSGRGTRFMTGTIAAMRGGYGKQCL